MSVIEVAIIGDSFPDRVRRAINSPGHEKHHKTMADKGLNLGLDSSTVKVRWITKGGLTIPKLVCKLEAELPYLPQCKAYIVQIGSNDLCTTSETLFIQNLKSKLLPLLCNHGCTYIVLCQICHRKRGKYTAHLDLVDYNSKVDKIKHSMAILADSHPSLAFWQYKPLLRCGSLNAVWDPDGVHLLPMGLINYWRSLRGAVWNASQEIR